MNVFEKGIFVYLSIIMICSSVEAEQKQYRAESDGNLLQLTTPYGSRIYFSDVPLSGISNFQFEVLLSDIKPAPIPSSPDRTLPSEDPKFSNDLTEKDALVLKANELYNKGKFKESLKYVDELLQREPKHVRGWIMKGSLMHVIGQRDLAKNAWQKALELDPNNSQIKAILGRYE